MQKCNLHVYAARMTEQQNDKIENTQSHKNNVKLQQLKTFRCDCLSSGH